MTTSELETQVYELAMQIWDRLKDLILAPIENHNMLWIAVPLLAATIFITLYFGRYKKEELGWNTAFGNTMIFLFVAINLIKEMYQQGGSLENLYDNELYFSITVGLAGCGLLLMFITYFHLMPKKLAFFLFSAPPINVTIYMVMAVVYADVIPDNITILAGVVFLLGIIILTKAIRALISLLGLSYVIPLEDLQLPDDIAKKLRKLDDLELDKMDQEVKKRGIWGK
ncbi:hypothetical protein KKF81_03485 [Candidatus Micrarchaeota archaeon]|nr:hypothetical protein [Candidatus Micrarchaeota archaeon]MBU1165986.1 hypothetical protein [Candidatus Micrarchaeota archaeon]MBU1886437.1 hypothetical protein [Candidatus Micrarchaeota archaeon]